MEKAKLEWIKQNPSKPHSREYQGHKKKARSSHLVRSIKRLKFGILRASWTCGKCLQQVELSGENLNITYKPNGFGLFGIIWISKVHNFKDIHK